MIQAVIFDLDGVLVSTDECHYQAWKRMSDEENIPFDRTINERLRGVSRMESLDIILEKSNKDYSSTEKTEMATRKNNYYVQLIQSLTSDDLLPGALHTVKTLKANGIKIAVGSSSKNAPTLLQRLGIEDIFDAVAEGNDISRSKPDPEVFLLAASRMNIPPENCLVVEDADSGIEAAKRAGMKTLGVGAAKNNPQANISAGSLKDIDLLGLIQEGTL